MMCVWYIFCVRLSIYIIIYIIYGHHIYFWLDSFYKTLGRKISNRNYIVNFVRFIVQKTITFIQLFTAPPIQTFMKLFTLWNYNYYLIYKSHSRWRLNFFYINKYYSYLKQLTINVYSYLNIIYFKIKLLLK